MTKQLGKGKTMNIYSGKIVDRNPDFEKQMEAMVKKLGLKEIPFPEGQAIVIIPMDNPSAPNLKKAKARKSNSQK